GPQPHQAGATGSLLQRGGSSQPVGTGEVEWAGRQAGGEFSPTGPGGVGRVGLPAVSQERRTVAVSPHLQTLRADALADYDQTQLQRMAASVRRQQDDHRATRPRDPSL